MECRHHDYKETFGSWYKMTFRRQEQGKPGTKETRFRDVCTPCGCVRDWPSITSPVRISEELFQLSFHVVYSPWVQIPFLEQVTIQKGTSD